MGWIANETNSEYHANEGISATGIKQILRSPSHYQEGDDGPSPAVAADGNIIHAAILEGERYREELVTTPDFPYRGEGKQAWLGWFENLHGMGLTTIGPEEAATLKKEDLLAAIKPECLLVTKEQHEMVHGILDRLQDYPRYLKLLYGEECVYEQSGYCSSIEFPGIIKKVRPDVRCKTYGYLLDVKSTVDARKFKLVDFGYHIQCAWYLDIANEIDNDAEEPLPYKEFFWLVIEKKKPYGIKLYRTNLNSDLYMYARSQCQLALAEYFDCTEKDEWPGYEEDVIEANLPAWI